MRRRIVTVIAGFLPLLPAMAIAQPIEFKIEAGSAETTLALFGQQSGWQTLYTHQAVEGRSTPALAGSYEPRAALERILQGTGLTYEFANDHTVTILTSAQQVQSRDPASLTQEAGKNSSREFRVAQVGEAPGGSRVASSPEAAATLPVLTEVIVTAQKRTENIQNVPVPVTAISAETLLNSNQLRLQDYYASVPGLTVTPVGQTQQGISIRGITTAGSTTPTVGVTVDDVPYGSSTLLGGGPAVPDIDPGDLAQIEVLRGPQGTLYGVASIGGLLKFVTVDPSTDAISGRVQAGVDDVHNGAQVGYNVRGSVNMPLSDDLAIRASGFTREDPGYIDNPLLHTEGVNKDEAYGGRIAALWQPSQLFSVKLSALVQDIHGTGNEDVDLLPGLHDLQQNYIAEAGAYDRKFQAYSAIVKGSVGDVELTAISGFNRNEFSYSYDESSVYGGSAQTDFNVGNALLPEYNKTNKFSQELRLSAPLGSRAQWLLGGFYTHESSKFVEAVQADADSGQDLGQLILDSFPTTYTEYAAFTDLTFHFTNQFDVQIGGRESHITQSYEQTLSGRLLGGATVLTPARDSSANAFTYLLTPRLQLTPDLMLYARLASGYRAGAPNAPLNVPRESNPDKTYNYEIGAKADFLERRLAVDASVYYIDWKDIQVGLYDATSAQYYQGNAGRAKSQGVELSVDSKPWSGLTAGAWVAFDDAILTQAFPPSAVAAGVYGAAGDRLPFSSRFSGNVSLEQSFPLGDRLSGFVGGTLSYVGQRVGEFTGSAVRQELPAYARTDLRAGVKYDPWTVNAYVNNAADKRGVIYGGLGGFAPYAFDYIQPRTVGLSVIRTF
jgi:outer membrane receptor protein involved in Fe transport